MVLEGSCHCGAVRFSLESAHPYPFALCYCSICRKTGGGGGYAINLGGTFGTLRVEGEDHIRIYRAQIEDDNGASWVVPRIEASDKAFAEYPEESLAQWHERLGLVAED